MQILGTLTNVAGPSRERCRRTIDDIHQ